MSQEYDITKRKPWKQINEQERYKIEALINAGHSPSEVAAHLGRDRRTIERELVRGSVEQRRENTHYSRNPEVPEYLVERRYLADAGQRVNAEREANKGRGLKIGYSHDLVEHIEKKIGKEGYSPDAVIGEIKAQGLRFSTTICTRTLYNYIDRGLFLNISNQDLPVKKDGKKRGYRQTRTVALNNTTGRSIDERPEEINTRKEFGHWEMDCVVGKGKACLLVLTERKSRTELIFKMAGKTQECVIACLDKLERKHKSRFREIFKSITTDNGSEFLASARLEASILYPGEKRVLVYYAHPYSAFERGSNENANRLIRRFIPKGTDIGKLTNAQISRIERWINNYPRRIFAYRSAVQVMLSA